MSQGVLEEALAALTARALAEGTHPSPDDLLSYQANECSDHLGAGVEEHLAWCTECNQTILDLASWPDIELRDPGLERQPEEEAADWRAIQARLTSQSLGLPVARSLPNRPQRIWRFALPVAALLLLAISPIGVGWLLRTNPPTPAANLFVVDLAPVDSPTKRTTGSAATDLTDVPAGMGTVVFLLTQENDRLFKTFKADLLDEQGRTFWRSPDLARPLEGGFSIAVPLSILPSEAIEIRLYGADGRDQELLSIYRARVRPSTTIGPAPADR